MQLNSVQSERTHSEDGCCPLSLFIEMPGQHPSLGHQAAVQVAVPSLFYQSFPHLIETGPLCWDRAQTTCQQEGGVEDPSGTDAS